MKSKRFIELTISKNGKKVFINPNFIGHISHYTESGSYAGEEKEREVSIVGVVTHNNGGFSVLENPETIMEKIDKCLDGIEKNSK